MTPADRAKSRLAAIGPQPPWWRPFKRRKWRRAVKAIVEAFSAELAAETAAALQLAMEQAFARFAADVQRERVVN